MAAGDAMPSSEKAMYVPANWEFVVSGELPALDSEAPVYVFADETEPTDAQLAELLGVFDVDGTFSKTTTDPGTEYAWTSWTAGSIDGSSPSITVSDDGLLSWWYSQGWQDMSVGRPAPCPDIAVVDPVEPATGDADSPVTSEESVAPCEEWVEPTPPANVPSAAEAESRFAELMSRFGFTADDLVVESYADDWSAGAWAYVLVDGVRSSLSMSASFGENGQLTYAGGYLARPEALASYPRIGTEAGVERLRSDYGGNYGRGVPEPAIAVDDVMSDDTSVTETIVSDTITPDTITPETITVEIVGVEEEYMLYWSVDGDVYLVPGYTYVAAEDEWGYSGRYTVPAIPSEYLDIVQPPVVDEPMPVEPAPVEPGEEGAVGISVEEAESLIGLTEADAVATSESKGWTVRVVARDGEEFPITMDYSTERVNLTVVDDVVTEVYVG